MKDIITSIKNWDFEHSRYTQLYCVLLGLLNAGILFLTQMTHSIVFKTFWPIHAAILLFSLLTLLFFNNNGAKAFLRLLTTTIGIPFLAILLLFLNPELHIFNFVCLAAVLSYAFIAPVSISGFFVFLSLFGAYSTTLVLGIPVGFTDTLPVLSVFCAIVGLLASVFKQHFANIFEIKLKKSRKFGGSIAHEMRTPLACVNLITNNLKLLMPLLLDAYRLSEKEGFLKNKIDPDKIKFLEELPIILRNCVNKSNATIDGFLLKIRDPYQAIALETLSMSDSIERTLKDYPFSSNEQSLVYWKPSEDFCFLGNFNDFRCVIENLIKNALFFIRCERKGSINIWTEREPNCNKLYFMDTAKGIAADKLRLIFEDFYTEREGGTGLGLPCCKEILESFGGRIDCESVEGEYTKFILSFPLMKKELLNS